MTLQRSIKKTSIFYVFYIISIYCFNFGEEIDS